MKTWHNADIKWDNSGLVHFKRFGAAVALPTASEFTGYSTTVLRLERYWYRSLYILSPDL